MTTTVFIGGLPLWVTSTILRQWLIDNNLTWLRATILRDHAGETRGCALIECSTSEMANKVIERFNQSTVDGRVLKAELSRSYSTPSYQRSEPG